MPQKILGKFVNYELKQNWHIVLCHVLRDEIKRTSVVIICRIISLQPLSVLRPVRKNSKYTGQVNDKEWDQPSSSLLFFSSGSSFFLVFIRIPEGVNWFLTRETTYGKISFRYKKSAKIVAYVVLKKGRTTRVNGKMCIIEEFDQNKKDKGVQGINLQPFLFLGKFYTFFFALQWYGM